MHTDRFDSTLNAAQSEREAAQAARKEAQRRRLRNRELRAFLSGGSLVAAGLLLATIYNLLAHQI